MEWLTDFLIWLVYEAIPEGDAAMWQQHGTAIEQLHELAFATLDEEFCN